MRTPVCFSTARPALSSSLLASFSATARQSRPFSQSQCLLKRTRLRRDMLQWLRTVGYPTFGRPLKGSTNYIGAYDFDGTLIRAPEMTPCKIRPDMAAADKPAEGLENAEDEIARKETEERLNNAADEMRLPREFPEDLRPFRLNPTFISQPVLGENLREAIYKMVVEDGKSVRSTSAYYNVTMERIAAVVRMKTMEREWVKQGKPLATPYSDAVLAMLPKTVLRREKGETVHEPINDLPVHPATVRQIFYPVSESRHFTRADAGAVFRPQTPRHAALLPADSRVPHPELIALEKAREAGATPAEVQQLADELEQKEQQAAERRRQREEMAQAKSVLVVPRRRVDFRFQDISVEAVGRDGRNRDGVGWRYGMPHEDRKPGQVKIPTSVP